MSALSKPAKIFVIGSAVLVLVSVLGLWLMGMRSSHQGWTCDWLDAPTIRHGTLRNQCIGLVHCRHRTMQTFVPQVRQVSCATTVGACDAAACFTQALSAPPIE